MLKPTVVRLIALSIVAIPAAAQVAPSTLAETKQDPAQLAALMANSQRTSRPASLVLGYKDELALTPDQVKQIELLARGEADSGAVRKARLAVKMSRLIKQRDENLAASQAGWSGAVNEKQLRDDTCEEAGIQIDVMMYLMRDRQAVGSILTSAQVERVLELESNDLRRAIKTKQP